MAIYETIFILDSLIPPKDIEATIQRYSSLITDNGGSVRKVDKWGKRRLAYEIQKKQYGYYIAIEFEGSGQIPRVLEADYNYNDKVIRFLTYRYDKNKLKSMEMEEQSKQKKQMSEPAEEPDTKEEGTPEKVSSEPEEEPPSTEEETEEKAASSAEENTEEETDVPEEESEEEKS